MALGKKVDKFISLEMKRSDSKAIAEGPGKIRYPTLYIHDTVLPISDKDVDAEMTAEVKIKVRTVSKSSVNGKESESYDLEIKSIRFK